MKFAPLDQALKRRGAAWRASSAAGVAVAAVVAVQEQIGVWVRSVSAPEFAFAFTVVSGLGAFAALYVLYRVSIERAIDMIDGIEPRLAGKWWFVSDFVGEDGQPDKRCGTVKISIAGNSDISFEGLNYRTPSDLTPSSVWRSTAIGIDGTRVSILYSHSSSGQLGASGLMVVDLLRGPAGLVLSGTFSDAGAKGSSGVIVLLKSKVDFDDALCPHEQSKPVAPAPSSAGDPARSEQAG